MVELSEELLEKKTTLFWVFVWGFLQSIVIWSVYV